MYLNEPDDGGFTEVLRIGIVAPDARTIEHLRELLAGWDGALSEPAGAPGDAEQAERLADQEQPDVMLVQGARQGTADLPALERLTARYPGMTVVLLAADQSPEFVRYCMRAGLREILPLAPTREALIEALQRVQQRRAAIAGSGGKIYSFIGCKGGSGATFLAANLAHALARDPARKVAFIDLNCQFGDAAFYLSHRTPACDLADVAQQVHRLDGELLASMMLALAPNFHLLPAPEQPEQALSIRAEHIDKLLRVAARRYDTVIVDAGRSLDALTVRAMDRSESVFAVLQLSLPFVRDAKRLLGALATLGYGRAKVKLLINRYERNGALTLADVAGTLKYEVYRTIPNSFDRVAASANQGVPIGELAPRDPVARSLGEMADLLSNVPKARSGWLRNLLPRRLAAAGH